MTKKEEDMTTLLNSMTAVSDAHLKSLHDRLASNADSVGLLDVGYRILDSPVGTLLLAATTEGLVRVAFDREDFDGVLTSLAMKVSPRLLAAPKRLDGVARQLDEYFAGQRQHFEVPLDLRLSKGFQRSVLAFLPDIRYGRTTSYASVAAAVHSPGAVRAVGTACARNPLPVIIPCHRVIRSDGHTGAYLGGPEIKQQLLDLESAA